MTSIGTWAYQCAAISASMRVGQCEIIARGLVVARRQNADGARPEELGTKLRARYRCGLKQIGSLRLAGERFARAPLWAARVLICPHHCAGRRAELRPTSSEAHFSSGFTRCLQLGLARRVCALAHDYRRRLAPYGRGHTDANMTTFRNRPENARDPIAGMVPQAAHGKMCRFRQGSQICFALSPHYHIIAVKVRGSCDGQ